MNNDTAVLKEVLNQLDAMNEVSTNHDYDSLIQLILRNSSLTESDIFK